MEIRIESILCNWDEKIPELFINLINVLALTRDENELRITIEKCRGICRENSERGS